MNKRLDDCAAPMRGPEVLRLVVCVDLICTSSTMFIRSGGQLVTDKNRSICQVVDFKLNVFECVSEIL